MSGTRTYCAFKRVFDLTVALLALVISSPLMLVVAMLVLAKLGRPILFRQIRPGLNGKPFTMFKFRTMVDARTPSGEFLADEERLRPFGRWLRSTSLDELPELWNVVIGDMSLVGPRPLLMHYLPHYSERQAKRHEVRPGITGWAQVNGRNALSWEEKFELDVWYVENCSLSLDLRIMCGTAIAVLLRRDIAAEGSATMPEFAKPTNDTGIIKD